VPAPDSPMKYLSLALVLLALPATTQVTQDDGQRPALGQPQDLVTADEGPFEDPLNLVVVYDVSDLILDRSPLGNPKVPSEANRVEAQELVDTLMSVMNTHKRGLDSIRALPDGHIVVTGHQPSHEYTVDFLEAQRTCPSAIVINFTMFEVPAGYLQILGIEGNSALFEDPAEFNKIMGVLETNEKVNLLSSPNVAVRPRGSAQIETINHISYVADYILQIVQPGNAEILDPVIDTVKEGLTVDVRAVPIPGGTVQFDLDVSYSLLQRPMRTVKTRIKAGDGPEVEISLPQVEKISLSSVLSLSPGSRALISSASPSADRDFVIVTQYVAGPSRTSPRVTKLFQSMRDGTYDHRWFPPLTWDDIPALLQRAESERLVKRFPTNPLSPHAQKSCPEGVIALWLIEGLFESGNLPSLNPILLQDGSKLSLQGALSTEQQLKLLAKARTAYSAWWKGASRSRQKTGAALTGLTSALKDTGLRWY
jgi:hypothetical protein